MIKRPIPDHPKTFIELLGVLTTEKQCREFYERIRFPDGVHCLFCGSDNVCRIKTRDVFECCDCRKTKALARFGPKANASHSSKQFSLKNGTVLQDSPLGFMKWLPAIWMLANNKSGISSYQLSKDIGLTQTTTWRMLMKLRAIFQQDPTEQFSGDIEADEVYIGGKSKWKSKERKAQAGIFYGGRIRSEVPLHNKSCVLGIMERGGRVFAQVVEKNQIDILTLITNKVAKGSTIHTDALVLYEQLQEDYAHRVVNHSTRVYTNHGGQTHTNSMENFWGHLRRGLRGTYIAQSKFHLQSYVDEQVFRFNTRKMSHGERFVYALTLLDKMTIGTKEICGKTDTASHPDGQVRLEKQLSIRKTEKIRKDAIKERIKSDRIRQEEKRARRIKVI